MIILNICSNGDVLKAMRIVNIIIRIITIVAPVILILSLALNYAKAVKDQDEDALNKANRNAIPKIISAILVFFIPGFVGLLADIVEFDKDSYLSCINVATTDNINNAYLENAKSAVKQAKLTLELSDYAYAEKAIAKVSDSSKRQQLLNELGLIKRYIEYSQMIDGLEKNFNRSKYIEIKEGIDNIKEEEPKSKLQSKLSDVVNKIGMINLYDLSPSGSLFQKNNELYNITLESLLSQKGLSVSSLDSKIKLNVESVGIASREAPVIAGLTLIEELSKLGYHVGYAEKAEYNKLGVNPNWGGLSNVGFVNWALRQGFRNSEISTETIDKENSTSMANSMTAICNVGDVLVKDDNIQLVASLDDEHLRYITIESEMGYGVRLSTVAYNSSVYNCRKVKGYLN